MYHFDKGILVGPDGPVVANPRSVGTPRVKKINGQDFYKGTGNHHIRSKMVRVMKDYFEYKLKDVEPIDKSLYPLEMELVIYAPFDEAFDIDNLSWIYTKVIQDCLKSTGIIPEDNAGIIRKSGGCQFIPVPTQEERKMLIILRHNDLKEDFMDSLLQPQETF